MKFRPSIKILTLVLISFFIANGDLYGQSKKKKKKALEKARAERAARKAKKEAETKTMNSDSVKVTAPTVEQEPSTTSPQNRNDSDVIVVDGDNSRGSSRTSSRTIVEEKKFSDRLWYGAGGILNFQGISGAANRFQIGLSPMVGFKVTEHLSFGPRLEVNYVSTRISQSEKLNSVSVGAGLFSRLKLFQIIFLHAEYDFVWDDQFFRNPSTGEIFSERVREAQLPLGIGYNNGYGGLGYEISLMYDVLNKDEGSIPIVYRAGLTYRF